MTSDDEPSIGGVPLLSLASIDEMLKKKHDLQHQLRLCKKMMKKGDILPYPMERAAILLRKEKRYEEELELCRYVAAWCENAERVWDGQGAMVWKSPVLQRCIGRIQKIEALMQNKDKTSITT